MCFALYFQVLGQDVSAWFKDDDKDVANKSRKGMSVEDGGGSVWGIGFILQVEH